MKKRRIIAIAAIFALMIALVAFSLLVSAEDAPEATLKIETVNRDANGKIASYTSVSSESGSYQTLIEKLANLEPSAETRYTITLTSDAVQTAPVSINAADNAEVSIKLDGHKLSYSLDTAAITVTGAGKFRVDGGYDKLGECGILVVSGDAPFLALSRSASAYADVKNVDATYFGSSLISLEAGELTLRESYVTYAGESASSVISAKDAVANIKYTDIEGAEVTTVLDLSSAKGYIEGGYIFAGTLVASDETASYALLASVDSEAVTAFKYGSLETVIYVLGGKLDTSFALASGAVNSTNLLFYYGDGTMILSGAGADKAEYGVQANCSFTESDGVYTMSSSSSSTAMATTVTLGEAPKVTVHSSYSASAGSDGIVRSIKSGVSTTTLGIITLLKDATISGSISYSGSEHTSIIVDLNGHKLTFSSTSTKSVTYAGNLHYTFDGAGPDGKRGEYVTYSQHQMFVYPRQASSTGIINDQLVTRIMNTDFTVANMGDAGSDALMNVNSGDFFMDKCSFVYTGAKLDTTTTGTSFYMLAFDHDFGPRVDAHINDVEVKSTYVGTDRAMNVNALAARVEARLWCNNVTLENTYTAVTGAAGASATFIDCDISVTTQLFSGAKTHVYDCKMAVPTGKLIASSGSVHIYVTDECLTTINTSGESLTGNYVTEEGYAMVPSADGIYKLTNGISTPEPITLPKIFANGMVFQRGKTINVFGYCPDTDAELKVTLGDRVGTTSVDENGEWYVELDPMEATWNLTLTIEQTNHILENKVIFTNVAVGEVWVTSGQSNAQMKTGYMEDVEELATLAETLTNVRTYRSNASYAFQPQKYGGGEWDSSISASNIRSTSSSSVSAIGYAAVAKIAAELGPEVPVALVHVSRGGSPIKGWIDYEALLELSPSEAQKYLDYVAAGVLDDNARTKIGTCLYNYQIAPYEGYEVAGVIWYQGCSDISGTSLGTEGATYTDYFKALERVYRRVWGNDDELPFYVVELAPYTEGSSEGRDNLNDFKAEQYDFCAELDNTYLISIMDCGAVWGDTLFSQGYIHPARKSPIANRCADSILANEYGIKYAEVYTHPSVTSIVADGSTVTVTFDTDIKLLSGVDPIGFDLSEDGTNWVKADARIEGNKIILTSSLAAPARVRYGQSLITAELADGTLVTFYSGQSKLSDTAKTITLTVGGVSYVIDCDADLIRTIDYGNVTNASGVPLPIFNLACGYIA